MEATHVTVNRVDASTGAQPGLAELRADLERAKSLANWMDSRFSLLGIRFGLDALVGLIPVVGDSLTAAVSLYPIWVAKRHGLGRTVQTRMAMNVLIDWLPGLVPVVGDVIDVAYKATLKNLKLLEKAAEKRLKGER